MRLTVRLALGQLRHQRSRWLLLVAGVALVVVIPVITSGLARAVQARTIDRTISGLDRTDSTLLVSLEGDTTSSRGTPAQNDVAVRRGLAQLTSAPIVHELLFRPIRARGSLFLLGGVDDLADDVALTGGRLPTTCTPRRCEVVSLGTPPAGLVAGARTIGVVVVGTVRRTSPVLATGELDPGDTPLLLGDGADAVGRLAGLDLFSRHFAWAAGIRSDRVVALGVGGWLRRAEAVSATLDTTVGGTTLAVPTDQLQASAARADSSSRRLGLLGGFAAVLLVGFAVVAAAGLRRDGAQLAAVLRQRGAATGQRVSISAVAVLIASVLALIVGAAAGCVVVGATWAHPARLDAPAAAGHALASSAVLLAVLTAGAALVVGAVLLWPETRPRDIWRVLDVLAVAALGAALLAGNRGSATAGDLSAGGDPLVIALPVLTAVIAGIVAARLWRPAVGLLDRLVGYRLLALRLALVGAVRRPLRPTATAAFLTASIAAVVFTGTYRATLLANDRDQAAYRVPLDVTVRGNIADPDPHAPEGGLGAGVGVYDVLRGTASVPTTPGAATTATLLAPEASALPAVQRWARTTGSDDSPRAIAGQLHQDVPAGPTLPAGTRSITATISGFDPNTQVSVWLRGADGRSGVVDLRVTGSTMSGAVPDLGGGPLTVTAFGVGETFNYESHRAHALGEGDTDHQVLTGRITVGALHTGSGTTWSWDGWGSISGGVRAGGSTLTIAYRLVSPRAICVPHYAAIHAVVLPVVTDPVTAASAHGGLLSLNLDADTTLTVRVAGTLPRMPTVSGPFVLADLTALRAVLDQTDPGRAVDELWVDGSSPQLTAFLQKTPLTVTRSSAISAALDADPIGSGTRTLLVIVAALALGGAAVALMLLVVGERRDGTGEMYAWEADGVAPRTLRRMLALRGLLVAFVGVPIGVAAGVVLAYAGARLVAVDATGTSPTPPIQVALGGAPTVLALIIGVGIGVAAGGVVALGALREAFPRPAELELR